eukprot:COSAG03_NODE_4190_length_1646_cov_5.779573_1_plen_320_part_10
MAATVGAGFPKRRNANEAGAFTQFPDGQLAVEGAGWQPWTAEMDPLGGSSLSILEDGGALALVLDRLDEDDALCAALACTTFRDLLFAQPRHAVRRAAGKPHAGKRIVTSVAGAASSVGRFAWVRGLSGVAPLWVRAWDWRTCQHLAAVGALEALQWARANGCEWDATTCAFAAERGHLEVLQWARANGCEWDASTCEDAARGGHLEVLQWARANGCEWDASTCSSAARGGYLEVLQWARANGCEWDATTCRYAAHGGHLEVLQWARANGCEWDATTCGYAALGGQLEVLQWARANGGEWDASACGYAAHGGYLEVLQWA